MSLPLRGTFPKTNCRRTATNVQRFKIQTILNLHFWREGIFATGFLSNLLVAQLPSWDLDVVVSVTIAVSSRRTKSCPSPSTTLTSMLGDVKSSALDYAHEMGMREVGVSRPTVACVCLAFERSHFGKSLDWINRFLPCLPGNVTRIVIPPASSPRSLTPTHPNQFLCIWALF